VLCYFVVCEMASAQNYLGVMPAVLPRQCEHVVGECDCLRPGKRWTADRGGASNERVGGGKNENRRQKVVRNRDGRFCSSA
jgi:hypothetical protein